MVDGGSVFINHEPSTIPSYLMVFPLGINVPDALIAVQKLDAAVH